MGYFRHKCNVIGRRVARNSRVLCHVLQQLALQRIVACDSIGLWHTQQQVHSTQHSRLCRKVRAVWQAAHAAVPPDLSRRQLLHAAGAQHTTQQRLNKAESVQRHNQQPIHCLGTQLLIHSVSACLSLPACHAAGSSAAPVTCACGTTTSSGRSPHFSSGMPTTAASNT